MNVAADAHSGELGPWNPGIVSQLPVELRHLSTILRRENVSTDIRSAVELQQLTGLTFGELVAFRPERLLLHELLIRVTADFSVPDGSRIEDLGINFREIIRRVLERHIQPQMPSITSAYAQARQQLLSIIGTAFAQLCESRPAEVPTRSSIARLFGRAGRRRRDPSVRPARVSWGPRQIAECERRALNSQDAVERIGYRSLARVLSALFTTNGRAWGTAELIVSLSTDMACNVHVSDVIGLLIEPVLRRAAEAEGYIILPGQQDPVVINTKGPSASGKSTLRPLQKKLAGNIGIRWSDFALISPDIWRKQLLDYATLGSAFRYAGAFTSDELQLIDQKLDRYMVLKHERGDMPHLLIDRFRFDSFAPDSEEAGSNLLTRFGHSVYLFFMITAPELLVERAWTRGLEVGRYKAVDDTLAHSVEAYSGMPDVFFTWVRRSDKDIRFEFLDNSVRLGDRPRTVAFGTNHTMNVLDVKGLLDIVRYARVNVDALAPEALYPDPGQLAPVHNLSFLRRCVEGFRKVHFADRATGRIYLRLQGGRAVFVDLIGLRRAIEDPSTLAGIASVTPDVLTGLATLDAAKSGEDPQYLDERDGEGPGATLGEWGSARAPNQPRKSQ
ncbi:MAG TPA: hypothetical protein VIY54_03760 [Steroidobacteraceae bacterium]